MGDLWGADDCWLGRDLNLRHTRCVCVRMCFTAVSPFLSSRCRVTLGRIPQRLCFGLVPGGTHFKGNLYPIHFNLLLCVWFYMGYHCRAPRCLSLPWLEGAAGTGASCAIYSLKPEAVLYMAPRASHWKWFITAYFDGEHTHTTTRTLTRTYLNKRHIVVAHFSLPITIHAYTLRDAHVSCHPSQSNVFPFKSWSFTFFSKQGRVLTCTHTYIHTHTHTHVHCLIEQERQGCD